MGKQLAKWQDWNDYNTLVLDEEHCPQGLSKPQICKILNCYPSTLWHWMQVRPEFSIAVQSCVERRNQRLAGEIAAAAQDIEAAQDRRLAYKPKMLAILRAYLGLPPRSNRRSPPDPTQGAPGEDRGSDQATEHQEEDTQDAVPTKHGLALRLGVTSGTIGRWAALTPEEIAREILERGVSRNFADFCFLLHTLDDYQIQCAFDSTAKGQWRDSVFKALASRHGYTDKHQVEVSAAPPSDPEGADAWLEARYGKALDQAARLPDAICKE